MKTSQKLLSLALALVLIFAFASCGSKSPQAEMYDSSSNESIVQDPKEAKEKSLTGAVSATDAERGGTESSEPPAAPQSADKIIYSGYTEIETLEFDKTIEDLMKMVGETGGFIQNSSVTGGDYASMYRGKDIYRNASYTIRIPSDKFKSVTDSLKTIGNVVSSNTNAENITMQYTDTEARLTACRTKEARLLELLSKATNMEDILAIENSLSDVRYEIESLTSQIKNWDSLISYSTLSIYIREVALYSKDSTSAIGYGQQLKETFVYSLRSVGHFFKDFLKFIVGALPVLAVLAIIGVPILFIIRSIRIKKKAKMSGTPDKRDENPPKQ